MAKQVKSVSGTTTTYTITDVEGNTLAVAVNTATTLPLAATFTSTGALLQDGMNVLMVLMQLIGTGLLP